MGDYHEDRTDLFWFWAFVIGVILTTAYGLLTLKP
jgi:hypothetical protein